MLKHYVIELSEYIQKLQSFSTSKYLQCGNPQESNQILDLVSHFDGEKMNLTRFTSFTFTTTRFWSIYVVILIGVVSMFCIEVTEMFRDGIKYFKSGANAMDCTNILCSGKNTAD